MAGIIKFSHLFSKHRVPFLTLRHHKEELVNRKHYAAWTATYQRDMLLSKCKCKFNSTSKHRQVTIKKQYNTSEIFISKPVKRCHTNNLYQWLLSLSLSAQIPQSSLQVNLTAPLSKVTQSVSVSFLRTHLARLTSANLMLLRYSPSIFILMLSNQLLKYMS